MRQTRRRGVRWAMIAAAIIATGFTAGTAVANPPPAVETPAAAAPTIGMGDVQSGALLFRTPTSGAYARAPALSTDIKIDVTGPILRATVTQTFRNDSSEWVEGIYAFPLPDDSAVDGLKLRIGDRFIEGVIKEKEAARKVYEQAKAEGRKASLVEQQRPNLFTNEVANIGPGEVIVAQIAFQQALAPKDGAFSLRMPLVVAPRYNPRPMVQTVEFGEGGWAVNDPVPDRAKIESPLIDPRDQDESEIANPVTLSVNLEAGFPIGSIAAPHHDVSIDDAGETGRTITLNGPVPADRDFELVWTAKPMTEPAAALYREEVDGEDYLLAFVTPPRAGEVGEARPPREVIFVQDVSGSMKGESIRQAKQGLEMALDRLRPEDSFNVIVFNDKFSMMHNAPVPATARNVREAVAAVRALRANGGTEMLPALSVALNDSDADNTDVLRQVIFLTDGAVGNETMLFALIDRALGRSRLFTVGIGSAPNSYFMTRAAEMGRGAHVFISDTGQVRARMEQLFAKIETPAMTDLTATWPAGMEPEFWPNPLPDVYAGEPVALAVRAADASGTLTLTGKRADGLWSVSLPLGKAADRPGIGKLWARQKIRALEGIRTRAISSADQRKAADEGVLETALRHGLVSRRTSLVAVDVEPARPEGAELVSAKVPLNLPAGWDPEQFLERANDLRDASLAPAPRSGRAPSQGQFSVAAAPRQQGAMVPRGSLNWESAMQRGLLLMLLGGLLMLAARRRA